MLVMQVSLSCAELWGGIRGDDLEVTTSGVATSLFSRAADGGKGGDIYYIGLCANDRITRVAVADVMGHGEAVSRLSQCLYESLHTHMNNLQGHTILEELNRIAEQSGPKALTTATLVSFYRRKYQLMVSSAGHPPVLGCLSRSGAWRPVELNAAETASRTTNLPLGLLEETTYDQEQLPVITGDKLLLYTDGVTEAPSPDGELFGEQRLLATLDSLSERPVSDIKYGVLAALLEHTGGSLHHDDVTVLALEIL